MNAINFSGDVSAGNITSQAFKLENIKAVVKGEKGLLSAEPIEIEGSLCYRGVEIVCS